MSLEPDIDYLSVEEVKAKIPARISDRVLKRRLRDSGLAFEYGRQLSLRADKIEEFMEFLKCSSSKSAPSPPTGKSKAPARSRGSLSAKVQKLIAETRPLQS